GRVCGAGNPAPGASSPGATAGLSRHSISDPGTAHERAPASPSASASLTPSDARDRTAGDFVGGADPSRLVDFGPEPDPDGGGIGCGRQRQHGLPVSRNDPTGAGEGMG